MTIRKLHNSKADVKDLIAAAEILRDKMQEGAALRDREGSFPYEQCAMLRQSGLLGLMVPKKYGGAGGSFSNLMKVSSLLAEGDPNVGQIYQLQSGGVLLMTEIASEKVQAKYLPMTANGELFITNAYSEVGTKFINEFKTTIRKEKSGWVLNGKKFYCTGSLAGDLAFGPAVVEGTSEVRIFYVDIKGPGVTIHDDWDGMGQRGTGSGTIEFENAHVEDELCFDPSGAIKPTAKTALVYQLVHTGVFVGIARNALSDARKFVQEKARLWYESTAEKPSKDPYTMLRFGEMTSLCHAAELMADRAAKMCDELFENDTAEVRGRASAAMGEARAYCAYAAIKIGEMLFQVCGSGSVLRKYGFDRHWRNARTLSLHNPLDFKYAHLGDLELNGVLPPVDAYN